MVPLPSTCCLLPDKVFSFFSRNHNASTHFNNKVGVQLLESNKHRWNIEGCTSAVHMPRFSSGHKKMMKLAKFDSFHQRQPTLMDSTPKLTEPLPPNHQWVWALFCIVIFPFSFPFPTSILSLTLAFGLINSLSSFFLWQFNLFLSVQGHFSLLLPMALQSSNTSHFLSLELPFNLEVRYIRHAPFIQSQIHYYSFGESRRIYCLWP